jgi:hypothetical protein
MNAFNPFEIYRETLQKQTDEELARWTAGWNVGSESRAAGELEMQRRRDQKQQQRENVVSRRAWIAIAVSIGSLMVSILAFVLRK